ncbi:MAG: hypothetical protein WAU47_11960 [Desulfobaccales bacterium]
MTTPWSPSRGMWATSYVLLRTLENRLAIARQNVLVQKKGLQIATARWQGGTTSMRDAEQATHPVGKH